MDALSYWMVIPAAFALDLLLGDPQRFPHPVRWMGRAITAAEPWFRRLPGKGVFPEACLRPPWSQAPGHCRGLPWASAGRRTRRSVLQWR